MPAPNIAFEGSPQELEAFMSELQRSPELAGAFKPARAPVTLGGMSIEDILAGGSPEQVAAKKQEIAAAQLRMKDFLAEAADKGGRLGMLSVVSQLSENPELAKAVSGLDAANRAAYAPKALGGKSIYNQGGIVTDPAYIEAQQEALGNKRLSIASALQNVADNNANRAAIAEQTNATRQAALAQTMALREAAAQQRQDALTQKQEQFTQSKLSELGKEAEKRQLPQLATAMESVRDILSNNPKGDIPGLGSKDALMMQNGITRSMMGEEAKANYSKARNALDIMLKAISGSAVTGSEDTRAKIRSMLDFGFNSDDFRNATAETAKILESSRNNLFAGYGGPDSEISSRYLKNNPVLGQSFVQPKSDVTGQPLAPKPGFSTGGLAIGTVQKGYVYKGGDPSQPSSWSKQ